MRGLERAQIGENVSERLDVTSAKFRVIVTHRPRYVYKDWDGVAQAAAPVRIIESGIPTEALLAQRLRWRSMLTACRFTARKRSTRDKVEIDRALMAQWMGRIGFELEPLAEHPLLRIKQGERIFVDEMTLPTLAASGKIKTANLWAYVRDDRPFGCSDPPMVAYRVGGSCVGAWLPVIWMAIVASCKSTDMPDISDWSKPIRATTARPAGRMCGASSVICTPRTSQRSLCTRSR